MSIDVAAAFGDAIVPVAPDQRATFAPATHLLYEWNDYWVDLPGVDELRVGDRRERPLRGNLFRVRFENQLGLTPIQPYTNGYPLAPPLVVEVLSPKFRAPAAHLAFFRTLLDDLFVRAARLPFTFSAETSRSVTEAMQPPTPLFAFHFLCQEARTLRAALATIQAAPHRVLADHPMHVPLAEAAEVGADVLLGILHAPEDWAPARGLPLTRQLHNHAPTRVWQRRPEESFDTPENRFVLAFLRALLTAAESIPVQPWWRSVPDWRQRLIREVIVLLQQAITHPMFDGVGALQHVPSASQVLLRREGYRDLRELWQLFHRARRPLFAPLQQAIALRDVATMYEVWGFFALTEKIAGIVERAPLLELRLSDVPGLGWTAQARFGDAGALRYNQTFRAATPSYRSYSVPLRPDYLWERAGKPDVALDAKFRLDRQDVETDGETPQATAKLADLYKMHTYRDALGVRAAVIIYPGDVSRFYDRHPHTHRLFTLEDLLLEDRSGIGAVPLRPDIAL